jgi:hypothetical protein
MFLKHVIPAIASPSSEPSTLLDISLVRSEGWQMQPADWADFVCRLTTTYDDKYVLGNFADPGDLLNYFLSIVPGAERMCEMQIKTTTSFSCYCRGGRAKEKTVPEHGITIWVDSDEPLLHHTQSF